MHQLIFLYKCGKRYFDFLAEIFLPKIGGVLPKCKIYFTQKMANLTKCVVNSWIIRGKKNALDEPGVLYFNGGYIRTLAGLFQDVFPMRAAQKYLPVWHSRE